MRREYKGHVIELRRPAPPGEEEVGDGDRARGQELLIDEQAIPWGQLPNGLYYLEEYAYDWRDNLIDLAKRLIDYRARISKRSRSNVTRG